MSYRSRSRNLSEETCKKCFKTFIDDDEDSDNHGTRLCYYCFEEEMENYEERRRERIALENEY